MTAHSALCAMTATCHSRYNSFWNYVEQNLVTGHDGSGSEAKYIPYHKLEDYWSDDNIKQLLGIIGQIIDCQVIQKKYLRVFSILVAIRMTSYIGQFVRHGQDDDHAAPLKGAIPGLSEVTRIDDLYERYREKQWIFCPVKLSTSLSNTQLHDRSIFPIVKYETLTGGDVDVTTTLKVKLDKPCNHYQKKDIVVFKVHKDEAAFNNEVKAFLSIQSRSRGSGHVVEYYGSFTQGDRFTIILEYANGGSLLDFFKREQPPQTWEELRTLWAALFCLLGGLAVIHNIDTQPNSNRGSMEFQAVHQDIKPSNILVFIESDKSSRYDVTLKFADFDKTHTLVVEAGNERAEAIEYGGTRTYGSPKVCRPLKADDDRDLTTTWEDDIWSLGCLYSETAVWCVSGEPGRDEYRDLRRSEVPQELHAAGYEDAFHDGKKRLDAVHEMHRRLFYRRRAHDTITFKVAELVLQSMITLDERDALEAHKLRVRSLSCLARAEIALDKAWTLSPREPARSNSGERRGA